MLILYVKILGTLKIATYNFHNLAHDVQSPFSSMNAAKWVENYNKAIS